MPGCHFCSREAKACVSGTDLCNFHAQMLQDVALHMIDIIAVNSPAWLNKDTPVQVPGMVYDTILNVWNQTQIVYFEGICNLEPANETQQGAS